VFNLQVAGGRGEKRTLKREHPHFEHQNPLTGQFKAKSLNLGTYKNGGSIAPKRAKFRAATLPGAR